MVIIMIKNILVYLFILAAAFVFSVVYYAWFSWFLLLAVICIPVVSLVVSLPFMIMTALRGLQCFCDDTADNFQSLNIGVRARNEKAVFCPFLRIKFKTVNTFAARRRTVVLKYGGVINKPVVVRCNALSQNCGCVDIKANYGRVYDFTGIFFLPVRLKFSSTAVIMPIPEKPQLLPDEQSTVILGYKPKPVGSFSDYYELREYRGGDSLKSIHWKLSSKYDDLIVKAPSEPVCKKLIIKPEITDNPDMNDFILARFIFVCSQLLDRETVFYALDSRSSAVTKIKDKDDVRRFLISLYCGNSAPQQYSLDDAAFYNILPEREEVSEL